MPIVSLPNLPDVPTEVFLTQPERSLGHRHLDHMPQPGMYLEFNDATYKVLERRHRYQLRNGKYQLHTIALYVQKTAPPLEESLVDGRSILGDATCRFNAHSELIRCAVNPAGPCHGCRHYEAEQEDLK